MKEVFRWSVAATLLAMLWGINACQDPCAGRSDDDPLGGEYFTVTYVDGSGRNLLAEVWRAENVEVWIDSAGSQGQDPDYYRLRNSFANGTFGPFAYTRAFTNVATGEIDVDQLLSEERVFDYYIRKDTFGIDTFTLRYRLLADECRVYWETIEYRYNGQVLNSYSGQRQAEIVITE